MQQGNHAITLWFTETEQHILRFTTTIKRTIMDNNNTRFMDILLG